MGLIRLQGVCKQYGPRMVLHDVSLELSTSERIGLVGPNGAGKTTLFKLIAGLVAPDSGLITLSKGLEIAYLPQEPEISEGRTLHDEVLSAFRELLDLETRLHQLSDRMSQTPQGPELDEVMKDYDRASAQFESAGGYQYEQRLEEILTGLGFSESDYALPMAKLSGGQKCRAALAKLLLKESHVLLLDEPTNHLDIDAVRWLEKFLAAYAGGAVIISHDRYLLDRVVHRIIEVDRSRVENYPGNYSTYVKTRDLRRLTLARQFEKDQEFIAKEREFIARHLAGQRSAEAKGRRTRLERMLNAGQFVTDRPLDSTKLRIHVDDPFPRPTDGQDVLGVQDLAMSYGEAPLFEALSFKVAVGERLGITGPNGTGKTTLLKILMSQVPPVHGSFHFAPRARIGYFAQEVDTLAPDSTIADQILAVRPELLEAGARNLAARFLFRGEDVFKTMAQLSGGEQSRVRLMTMLLKCPNTLILDEPTNHLDIASREVLEQALVEFPGTILAVSHDRYFLDRLCTRLLVLRPEGFVMHGGNYTSYAEECERREREAQAAAATHGGFRKQPAHPTAAPRKAPSKFEKMSLETLEHLIRERESELTTLQQRFGDRVIYQNPTLLAELRQTYDSLRAELEAAEAEWLERAE